jgi:hypothetical protein
MATAGEITFEVHRDWAPPFFGEGHNLLRRTRLAKICALHLDLDAMRRAHFSAQFRKPLPPSRCDHKMRVPAESGRPGRILPSRSRDRCGCSTSDGTAVGRTHLQENTAREKKSRPGTANSQIVEHSETIVNQDHVMCH